MARLALSVLGPLRAVLDGEPVTAFRSDKVRALLVYLALNPGRPHRREALASLLWPDQPEAPALHSLRQALMQLRAVLHDADAAVPLLQLTPKTVQFHTEADLWLDLDAFTSLLLVCRQHRHRRLDTCRSCLERLQEGAALYHGEFLQGFSVDSVLFEEWMHVERERRHRQALDILYQLAEHHLCRGEYGQAGEHARRQVALESWREEAHRQLMRALARGGQRSAALAQYQACRRMLQHELGVEPADETVALFEQIRAGTLDTRAVPHVPAPPTPLLGRKAELAQVVELLRDPACRLVTLHGPPGVGKTHLSLAVAAELRDDFMDGVYVIPLAAIGDPALLVSTIARALRVQETGDRPLLESLEAALHEQDVLLVLDNCEQLVGAAPVLAKLVADAPGLAVMATSRAALRLRGEHVIPVPPLALPPQQREQETGAGNEQDIVAAVAEYAAVALFVARAREAQADFVLGAANAAVIVEICRRLEGLPLAIELAAARIPLLSPLALLARLGSRLALLTGGAQDLPLRHQTLRDTIAWSYHLLDATEQVLFRRLAVFVGGCTIAEAEIICGGQLGVLADVPEPRIVDLLQALLDNSLLRVETLKPRPSFVADTGAPTAEPHFGMLETIQEYALEQLVASGEHQEVRRRHARYYLALAESAEPQLVGEDQVQWLDRLEIAHDNLRAALQWMVEHHEVALELRLSGALWRFWYTHSHLSEGRRWLEVTITAARSSGADVGGYHPEHLAKALHGVGVLAAYQGDNRQALAPLEEALALRRQLADPIAIAASLHDLAGVMQNLDDYGQATVIYEESLALDRAMGNTAGIAVSLYRLGSLAHVQSDYARATVLCEESLQLFRELGDNGSMAAALTTLGLVADEQGNTGRAATLVEESLRLYRQIDNKTGITWALHSLGVVANHRGDTARARALFEEEHALARDIGEKLGIAMALEGLADVARTEGDVNRNATFRAKSLVLYRELGSTIGVARCLEAMAEALVAPGCHRQAVVHATRYVAAATALRQSIGAPAGPVERSTYELTLDVVRTSLDEQEFAEAWAEGQAMTLDRTVASVLQVLSPMM